MVVELNDKTVTRIDSDGHITLKDGTEIYAKGETWQRFLKDYVLVSIETSPFGKLLLNRPISADCVDLNAEHGPVEDRPGA